MSWSAPLSVRWLSMRAAALWLLSTSLSACDEREQASPDQRRAPALQSPPAADVLRDASLGPSSESKSPSLAEAGATPAVVAPLSREKVLLQLLEPDPARWSSEALRERFAALGLQRSEPLPGSLQWVLHTATEHLQFNYLPDERGGWRFADVLFELPTASAAEATAGYKKYAALLQKRLGKPTWVKDDPRYRARGYKLGAHFEVSLGAVATEGDSQPYLAFSVAASQSQGD